MTADDLRPRLGHHTTVGELARIRAELLELPDHVAFSVLFPLATTISPDGTDPIAAALLVDRDPQCPLCCEEAVRLLALSDWQVSHGLVPFYFLMQFRRQDLLRAAKALEVGLPSRKPFTTMISAWMFRLWWESFEQVAFGKAWLLTHPEQFPEHTTYFRAGS